MSGWICHVFIRLAGHTGCVCVECLSKHLVNGEDGSSMRKRLSTRRQCLRGRIVGAAGRVHGTDTREQMVRRQRGKAGSQKRSDNSMNRLTLGQRERQSEYLLKVRGLEDLRI